MAAGSEYGYADVNLLAADPTPLGEGRNTHSLLPLIPDIMQPPLGPPPELYPDALTVLPSGIFQNARLEAGSKVDGVSSAEMFRVRLLNSEQYSNGVKAGVAEAEEKRRVRPPYTVLDITSNTLSAEEAQAVAIGITAGCTISSASLAYGQLRARCACSANSASSASFPPDAIPGEHDWSRSIPRRGRYTQPRVFPRSRRRSIHPFAWRYTRHTDLVER